MVLLVLLGSAGSGGCGDQPVLGLREVGDGAGTASGPADDLHQSGGEVGGAEG